MTNCQAANRPSDRACALSPHVLAVDDDPLTRALLTEYLGEHEIRVTAVPDGRSMQVVLAEEVVDLVVLDLKLQEEDGMAIAGRLRDASTIPIVMLSGLAEEADRVMGLELGADDYVTKPFSPRELLARVRAVLRRRVGLVQQHLRPEIRAYRFDGWELDLNARRLENPDGELVSLSNGEFRLLVALLRAHNRILSRDQLLEMLGLHGDDRDTGSVKTQIMRLRRKLESGSAQGARYVVTERGVGYVFRVPVEAIYRPATTPSTDPCRGWP